MTNQRLLQDEPNPILQKGLPQVTLREIFSFLNIEEVNAANQANKLFDTFPGLKESNVIEYRCSKEIQSFQNSVMNGYEEEIEKMLKTYPGLASELITTPWKIRDNAGRIFTISMSAYGYAFWSNDKALCRFLESHLDDKAKAMAYEECERISKKGAAFVLPVEDFFKSTILRQAYLNFIEKIQKLALPLEIKASIYRATHTFMKDPGNSRNYRAHYSLYHPVSSKNMKVALIGLGILVGMAAGITLILASPAASQAAIGMLITCCIIEALLCGSIGSILGAGCYKLAQHTYHFFGPCGEARKRMDTLKEDVTKIVQEPKEPQEGASQVRA